MSVFSCRDTVRLVSESLERELAVSQRLAVRVHLCVCPPCARFRRQLLFLHRVTGRFEGDDRDGAAPFLSPEARERIRRALQQDHP